MIPWHEFKELEIQALLVMHQRLLGYKVDWRHREDRAHEEGVDIFCRHETSGKTVAISVKKDPKKKDLYQFIELAKADADDRYYVYVGTRSGEFRRKATDERVRILDSEDLEKLLEPLGLQFQLIVDNTPFVREFSRVRRGFSQMIVGERAKPSKTVSLQWDQKDYEKVWIIKDRATSIHKCLRLIQHISEAPFESPYLSDEAMKHMLLVSLDHLDKDALSPLIEAMDERFWQFVRADFQRRRSHSDWLYLYKPGFYLQPGHILEFYETPTTEVPENLPQSRKQTKIFEFAYLFVLSTANIFWAIESITDNIYQSSLGWRKEQPTAVETQRARERRILDVLRKWQSTYAQFLTSSEDPQITHFDKAKKYLVKSRWKNDYKTLWEQLKEVFRKCREDRDEITKEIADKIIKGVKEKQLDFIELRGDIDGLAERIFNEVFEKRKDTRLKVIQHEDRYIIGTTAYNLASSPLKPQMDTLSNICLNIKEGYRERISQIRLLWDDADERRKRWKERLKKIIDEIDWRLT